MALGWEYDRIAGPFLPQDGVPPHYKPHRLILIIPGDPDSEGYKRACSYADKIEERLDGICKVTRETVSRYEGSDFIEFYTVVDAIAKMLVREIRDGNRVFVNISGGSKVAAFAAGLAAMAWINDDTGAFYYVQPQGYAKDDRQAKEHGMGVGVKQVIEFPPVAVGGPTMPRIWALGFLGQHPDGVEQHDLLRFLRDVPGADLENLDFSGIDAGTSHFIGGTRGEDSRARMRLKRGFLDPLYEEGYVDFAKRGRKRIVTLTRKGHMYARLAPPPDATP